ncbi:hypothetical protein FRC17_003197 [Serendipita sp. 399]|nr:hypothetical protein FRC17_003197 [Serendipita sp. 399]
MASSSSLMMPALEREEKERLIAALDRKRAIAYQMLEGVKREGGKDRKEVMEEPLREKKRRVIRTLSGNDAPTKHPVRPVKQPMSTTMTAQRSESSEEIVETDMGSNSHRRAANATTNIGGNADLISTETVDEEELTPRRPERRNGGDYMSSETWD